MADSKLYLPFLVVFLLICQRSYARPLNVLAGENIVLVSSQDSKSWSDQTYFDEDMMMKVRRERVNMLLHRLPKGKKPVSGPSKRTNNLND
ncbi:hypothetical protein KY290_027800 [Solanum tuberosum]|uniref:Uncharacterized protein n=2 Tax=Solanum tuberosum TaxID=4113 RepID=A0ABQ7UHV6_SOLTU|nr:hypothetical protein KY289_026993 [Solanum tuberosum]KAH0661885.1 hypothetical protein KY284_026816 [Solanum tuberosum]KAH0665577.1 hypothetical protein KY285_026783 [Solanum tuberosum]KAH0748568.1 hypothetical protein KY290_027800 [Solanum tuberosum]